MRRLSKPQTRRTGTLFEGRFRSSLIEADRYRMACQRDIELKPVRVRLVSPLEGYPWSSDRCNALSVADRVVTVPGSRQVPHNPASTYPSGAAQTV